MASAVTQYLILLQPSHRQVRSRRRSPSPSPERARAVIDRRLRLRPQRQRRSPSASDSVIFVEDTPSDDEELPLGILPHNASLSRAGTGTSNVATGATSSRVAGPATLTVRGAGSSEPLGPITSADVEAWQKTKDGAEKLGVDALRFLDKCTSRRWNRRSLSQVEGADMGTDVR